ncbi:MAG: SDR family oxidoreductase [Thermoanaerobaculia bacterium]|nr:SDR family oxidoreductase [Thermoanaerobaculia bacterium]
MTHILVTGGGGYVGSALVPRLLERGERVTVLDLFWYGEEVLEPHERLRLVRGDIRDADTVARSMAGVDAVIHLACISNDPSFELDPTLGKSINLDAFPGLVDAALSAGVDRFVYASSSSIYGVQDLPDVVEDTPPLPLTDYSRFKLDCERILLERCSGKSMASVIVRPATVCGWAPRMRFDLTVNILTLHALVNGRIRVFGGSQLRPNLHIDDMVRAYETLLDTDEALVAGEAFNVGYRNLPVADIAILVRETLGDRDIEIATEPSDDLRSYHIAATKIADRLGFLPQSTLESAVRGIRDAFERGGLESGLEESRFHNIRRMRELMGDARLDCP